MKHLAKAGILVIVLFLSVFAGISSMQVSGATKAASQLVSSDVSTHAKKTDPYAFFMADGTKAHFKGVGNEYAELTIRTKYLKGNHVALYEDNGGTVVLRVYRLSKDRIELVKQEAEFYKEYKPTLKQLKALKPISTYLKFPLKKGDVISGRKVVSIDATVSTPYKKFRNAIVLEQKYKDGGISKTYFVEGFGEVKREFILKQGKDTYKVTSSLESIK
ncbi:hypothetical protein QWY14_07205 [Planococcus sp. N028]|uniref:Uncharacterized protein n=1 Tax=Planococcus shixiaomingii TaxID=3058393 RepID=A0ABT8N100_9BACL|nr:hypothetical protein [Planococcus sp. N028]MDN7241574.1 hypothetical protein [Planococcus sp. N028]